MTKRTPRILVVEDEFLVAFDVRATLTAQGWEVLGPAPDVDLALKLLSASRPDAVCLDMNLKGGNSVVLATCLREKDIPFVILTGDTARLSLHPAFQGVPVVEKPFCKQTLVSAIAQLLRGQGPRGFGPQATACAGNRPRAMP